MMINKQHISWFINQNSEIIKKEATIKNHQLENRNFAENRIHNKQLIMNL